MCHGATPRYTLVPLRGRTPHWATRMRCITEKENINVRLSEQRNTKQNETKREGHEVRKAPSMTEPLEMSPPFETSSVTLVRTPQELPEAKLDLEAVETHA